MIIICYIFIFIFEQIVSFMYFNNKFYSKKPYTYIIIALLISFAVQFSGNLIGNEMGFSEINLITFFFCNILFVLLLFKTTIKQAFFNVILLEGLMITSELGVMHLTSFLLRVDLQDYLNDNSVIILETIGTKTLYFSITYFISKFSTKEKEKQNKNNTIDISYLLFILPLSAIGIIISFTYLSINYDTEQFIKLIFTIISIVLLFANIIVFIVHERMIKTSFENTELQLEKQKNEINEEYYKELSKQYESSNLLIHDIKKCLMNIRTFANSADNEAIMEYIDSIYQGYNINRLKQFSNNKLVNIIISRYSELCINNNIVFSVDIRNVDFSSISNSDLTALLDSLLENAYEAALYSSEKQISVSIDNKNENYIILDISNSTETCPKIDSQKNYTTKKNNDYHGLGLKSIKKIAKRYSGKIEYKYDEKHHIFTVLVIIKSRSIKQEI